jgi:RNA methyltransferase, TrmH family
MLPDGTFILFLDNVQDPGNVGTILRTADWFGIKKVFVSPTCADAYAHKVVQATMGAFLRIEINEITFAELEKNFPNTPKIGTILGGDNIFAAQLPKSGIIVMGNEAKGVADEIIEKLDFKLEIAGAGGAESLNVSVATGIVCALLTHQ